MPTKPKAEKKPSEFISFYEGKAVIEKKPWGDFFRFTVSVGGETPRSGMLSATGITKYLDKSQALIPWAVGLVGSHVTSSFQNRTGESFSKDEIYLVVGEAILKPEEAKVAGGKTGDVIHDFAHAFAKAQIEDTDNPSIPTMDHLPEEEKEKALNGINAFLDWFNNNDVEFLEMEKLVYYNSLLAGHTVEGEEVIEYFGIMDVLARVNGKVKVMDYKTGKRVYSEQRYQLSGYRQAWNSNPDNTDIIAQGSEVLNFSKETGELVPLEISEVESEKDFGAFKGLYLTARREKELDAEYKNKNKNESK